ncbi:MAG: TetR/AcrR family transcriptional regulator [Tepidiformaceae bacterium]
MPTALTDVDIEELRARLLRAFAARAQVAGLRSVSIADLAGDAGISSKTLYRCFESKDQLVQSLIERWVGHLFEDLAANYGGTRGDALTALRQWGEAWVRGIQKFSPAFWAELERDYPRAFAAYVAAVRDLRHRARAGFSRDIRPGTSPEFAQAMFLTMVRTAADPAFCDRHGMTRQSSVGRAIDLWAVGCLQPHSTPQERGK